MRQAMPPALTNQELLAQEMILMVDHWQHVDHPIPAPARISPRTEDNRAIVVNTRGINTLDVEIVHNRLRTVGILKTIAVQSTLANIKAM